MPQSLQLIYSFDCEVIFCILKLSPFSSWSVFVDREIKITMVSQRIWHIFNLFFNMFLFQTVVITMTTTPTVMMAMI